MTATATSTPIHTLLRPKEAAKKLGIGLSSLYEKVASGELKPPIKLGPRASAFIESEIDAFIAERVAARNQGAAA